MSSHSEQILIVVVPHSHNNSHRCKLLQGQLCRNETGRSFAPDDWLSGLSVAGELERIPLRSGERASDSLEEAEKHEEEPQQGARYEHRPNLETEDAQWPSQVTRRLRRASRHQALSSDRLLERCKSSAIAHSQSIQKITSKVFGS